LIDTESILANSTKIFATTPIEYLKGVELAGSLFEENCTTGAVSCVFTEFYVGHAEPLSALEDFKEKRGWTLGELPEGHEFLSILPIL